MFGSRQLSPGRTGENHTKTSQDYSGNLGENKKKRILQIQIYIHIIAEVNEGRCQACRVHRILWLRKHWIFISESIFVFGARIAHSVQWLSAGYTTVVRNYARTDIYHFVHKRQDLLRFLSGIRGSFPVEKRPGRNPATHLHPVTMEGIFGATSPRPHTSFSRS
jgi:hypothetical protein